MTRAPLDAEALAFLAAIDNDEYEQENAFTLSDHELEDAICIDCEMVQCGRAHALAQVCAISVADESVLFESYVMPTKPVTDYLTRYSGIRAKDLEGAPCFEEVQAEVALLIDGRVVVGHGLDNDLKVLQLQTHPPSLQFDTLIDLAWGAGQRKGLAYLSLELLGEPIQRGGHSPKEDAIATVRLLKLWRRHGGCPPPCRISLHLRAAEPPAPPSGCDWVEAEEEEAAGSEVASSGAADPAIHDYCLSIAWATDALSRLLTWYADLPNPLPSDQGGGLRFAASLPKEHRNAVRKESKRCGLEPYSRGLGDARSIMVLPKGEVPHEPSAETRRLAELVMRWSRTAAEEESSQAMPAPYTQGELEEILEDGSKPPPESVAMQIAKARSVLSTCPLVAKDGESAGKRALWAFERMLVVQGRGEGTSDKAPKRRGGRH